MIQTLLDFDPQYSSGGSESVTRKTLDITLKIMSTYCFGSRSVICGQEYLKGMH